MMATKYVQRTREFRGIQPGSVAIKARMPGKNTRESALEKSRAAEENFKGIQVQVKEQRKQDNRTDFETNGEKRILAINIKNRVKTLTEANECNLECRREKLHNLLANEELCLMKEAAEKQETVLERQAKMRERAKFLKDKRESERLAFVQEKYDQQFRSQCEELRSILSKRHQEQVCLDQIEQLRQKEEMTMEKKAIDKLYDQLWEQDMLEKAAKEERDAKAVFERNREVLDVLRKQMAALEAHKEETRLLKEEEAQLLKEQQAMWKVEDEFKQKEKVRRQNETRDMLNRALASKAKRKAIEEQEELAFDLKMLEQLVEESNTEAAELIRNKRERQEEDHRYRTYLRKLVEEEKAKEKELERMIQQDMDAAWEKRIERWRQERLARKLLLNDVMEGRARQIKERLQENERCQAEIAREREAIQCQIEANKRYEAEVAKKRLENGMKYQNDLRCQMAHNTQKREEEQELEKEEYLKAQQTEKEFQARMKHVLDNAAIEKVHPMRKAMMAQFMKC